MISLALAAMTALAVAALALPLRARRALPARRDYDAAVYRDQLAEVARDRARGTIDEAEAAAARAEIGRRLLAAAGEPGAAAPAAPAAPVPSLRPLALVLAVVAPAAALVLYLGAGSPGLPGQPFASRQRDEPVETRIARMVDELQRRLAERPDDAQGWRMLAMGLGGIGRHAEAVQAWRRVMQLSNDAPEYAAQFGESLTMATSGAVTPEALAQFERARAADPQDARARFYIGLARVQAGDPRAGLQVWVDMVAGAPADAPWLAEVRARIAQTAREAGIDPATIAPSPEARAQAAARPPAPPRAPAPPDGQALGNIPPEQRAQIRGMVEGLAARLESSPDDLDGWRRLGRSWLVLGERDRARAAYARAAALAPDNVAVLADYAQTWTDELDEGQPLPAEYAALMRRILALDPDFPEALWSVGLAEMAAGNRAAAIALWERLVAHLPAGSPQAAAIRARIEQLRAP